MKAFEDWLKDTKFEEVWCYECGGISKQDLSPVWKAALEWALETAEELERTDAPVFMNDVIRNELNGNDE